MAHRTPIANGALLVGFVMAASGCSDVTGGVPGSGAGTCIASPPGDAGGDDDAGPSSCKSGDTDGINGGCSAFDLTVDDTGFTPIILKAQNLAQVTLTVTNHGTKPHDLVVGCLPTPNVQGCPAQSCFPAAANLAPIPSGGSASTTFVTPNPEGIYTFRSDVPGDSDVEADGGMRGLWGQLVIQ